MFPFNFLVLFPQLPFLWKVIYGTPCFCSLSYLSYGVVICGTFVVYMVACTTIGTTHTIVWIVDGFTLPLVIFYALAFALSYFVFTPEF